METKLCWNHTTDQHKPNSINSTSDGKSLILEMNDFSPPPMVSRKYTAKKNSSKIALSKKKKNTASTLYIFKTPGLHIPLQVLYNLNKWDSVILRKHWIDII